MYPCIDNYCRDVKTVENTENIVFESRLGFLFIGSTDLINTLGVPTGMGRPSVHGSE